MDLLSGDLDSGRDHFPANEETGLSLNVGGDSFGDRSAQRSALPDRLFNLGELDVLYDQDGALTTVTAVSQVNHRPCFEVEFDDGNLGQRAGCGLVVDLAGREVWQ